MEVLPEYFLVKIHLEGGDSVQDLAPHPEIALTKLKELYPKIKIKKIDIYEYMFSGKLPKDYVDEKVNKVFNDK